MTEAIDPMAAVEAVLAAADEPGAVAPGTRLGQALAALRATVAAIPAGHPIGRVRWVPVTQVRANDYNPNRVASRELDLLATSIRADGYTQPVVTVKDPADGYEIVDGFHRRRTLVEREDVYASTGGLLPVVVIDGALADRMASTVRPDRARGKHRVDGMSQIVFGMLEEGRTDAEVCQQLGMEPDELVRLKYVTGFAKLFEDVEYRRSWETRRQARVRFDYKAAHPDEEVVSL